MVKAGIVNGGGFRFFAAAQYAIFDVFVQKCALQEVR
jgi:hypothetical protein